MEQPVSIVELKQTYAEDFDSKEQRPYIDRDSSDHINDVIQDMQRPEEEKRSQSSGSSYFASPAVEAQQIGLDEAPSAYSTVQILNLVQNCMDILVRMEPNNDSWGELLHNMTRIHFYLTTKL